MNREYICFEYESSNAAERIINAEKKIEEIARKLREITSVSFEPTRFIIKETSDGSTVGGKNELSARIVYDFEARLNDLALIKEMICEAEETLRGFSQEEN